MEGMSPSIVGRKENYHIINLQQSVTIVWERRDFFYKKISLDNERERKRASVLKRG